METVPPGRQAGYTETAYNSGNTEEIILSGNHTFISSICGTCLTTLVGQFPQKPLSRMKAKSVDSEYHI